MQREASLEGDKFGVLVRCSLLTERELADDVEQASRESASVAAVLMRRRHISKASVGYALHSHYQRPFLDCDGVIPSEGLSSAAGKDHLREHCWLPLAEAKGLLHVWTDDPASPEKKAAIERAFPGRQLRLYVGLREDILRMIEGLALAALLLLGPLAGRAAAAPTGPGDDSAPKIGVAARPAGPADTELMRAEMVARAAEMPLEFIQAMRESGLDWDHITRELEITLGPDRRPWRGALLRSTAQGLTAGGSFGAARVGTGPAGGICR